MSSTVSAPFKLELRYLRWQFASAICAIAAITVVPWLLQDLSILVRVVCSAGGLLAVVIGLHRAGWLQREVRVRLVCDSTGDWQISERDDPAVTAALHADTRCFRHFIWLRFVASRTVLIGPGDLDPEAFRRLKVTLLRIAPTVRERVA